MIETKSGPAPAKTLICISGIANKGKTETAREVINRLKAYTKTKVTIHETEDKSEGEEECRYCIFKAGNQIIGVDTVGDPYTDFPYYIKKLAAVCDAIVCTCRTSGETFDSAIAAAAEHGFLFIKTTTYQPDYESQWGLLNGWKADHIISLLENRGHL